MQQLKARRGEVVMSSFVAVAVAGSVAPTAMDRPRARDHYGLAPFSLFLALAPSLQPTPSTATRCIHDPLLFAIP
jgi:hypothetical protein